MKKTLLFIAMVFTIAQAEAQKAAAWSKVGIEKATTERVRETPYALNQQFYQLDLATMRNTLSQAADRFSGLPGVEVLIPNAEGQMEKFLVWENSNFEPALQAQFPEIRAYVGKGVNDKTATISFSVAPTGIQTMVLRGDKGSEFIEPFTKDRSVYVFFDSKSRVRGSLPLVCTTEDVQLSHELNHISEAARANNGVMKTMRLALSCTGEYAQYFGGTVTAAVTAMNATMTRVNGIFERDLALRLNIIANNTLVVYTNPATDPYSPANQMQNWNSQLQTTLTNVIGEANYDIGHLFGASGGGGNAGCIGCVCGNGKGSAITSPADNIPMGDTFDIDYVAHEFGHQLGANHTFSHSSENNAVNVEPGSGSTIMAYAGITGATDVQANSDDYFVYRSIVQIQNNLASKTCPVTTTMVNQTPIVDAGLDYTIPIGTAFILTGTGTDPNGDALTFCWEQNDDATTVGAAASYPSGTKTQGPNFRSRQPLTVPVRYMPSYQTVLNGATSNTWEVVSTVARTLNFVLTARDNFPGGGQTQTDAMIVSVNGSAGPFAVTSQNVAGISWTQGTTQTITWSVNNTATLQGSANVKILLSTDNGLTWPITLAASTPNDGSETITVPNVAAPNCRIWIQPVGNIYYAINSKPFAIGYTVSTSCATYNNNTSFAIPDGLAANTSGPIATSTINVPATGSISDVNVGLNVSHTYVNDIVLGVVHPDGTQVLAWNRACGSQDNFNITLNDGSPAFACANNMTGTYNPSQPLSAFNGKPANGTWTLRASDWWNEDTGTVNSWSLEVCVQVATLASAQTGLTDFAVYPNPNNGNFNIQFESTSSSGVKVMVHDMRGRLVFDRNFANQATFNQNIQLNNVQSGMYLLTVADGDRKEVRKIVIE
jgi:subtilisin-like proprotein convertase family protein